MKKYSKGFTIIELITVIAIIGILTTIVIANVTGNTIKAKEAAVKENMRTLSIAAANYIADQSNSSNFCISIDDKNMAAAIANIDPNYILNCVDPNSTYSTPDPEFGHMLQGAENDAASYNCSAGEWYSYIKGLNNSSGCWCIDSTGVSEDSCGNFSDCACN